MPVLNVRRSSSSVRNERRGSFTAGLMPADHLDQCRNHGCRQGEMRNARLQLQAAPLAPCGAEHEKHATRIETVHALKVSSHRGKPADHESPLRIQRVVEVEEHRAGTTRHGRSFRDRRGQLPEPRGHAGGAARIDQPPAVECQAAAG